MTRPTIVVGIGQAGARMISNLNNLIEKEGKQDYFKYIAIDSQSGDLDREAPQRANLTSIPLDKPTPMFKTHREEFFYLDSTCQLTVQEGTSKQRPVSRYHIDNNNFRQTREQLITAIREFERKISDQGIGDSTRSVWILNAFGGGTGSGAFPLIASILRDELDPDEYLLNGIGSLPRVDEFGGVPPSGHNQHYANAFTALEELKELINYDNRDGYETPEIYIESGQWISDGEPIIQPDPGVAGDKRIFDNYWLIGYKEDEPFDNYRHQLNQVASNAIYYMAEKDEPEDFPYVDGINESFMALSSAELSVPVDEARNFVNNKYEIRDLTRRADGLKDDIEALQEVSDYLHDVSKCTIELDQENPTHESIHNDVLSESRNATDLDLVGLTQDIDIRDVNKRAERDQVEAVLDDEILDPAVSAVESKVMDPPGVLEEGDEFDKKSIISKFYCKILYQTIEKDYLNDHDFVEKVNEAWEEYREELKSNEDQFRHIDNEDPVAKWTTILDDWLIDYADRKRNEAEKMFGPRIFRQKAAKTAEETHDEIEPLYKEYERLARLADVAKSRYTGVEDEIIDQLNTVNDAKNRKRREKRRVEESINKLERRQETLRETLREGKRRQGTYYLPMHNLEDLDYDDLYRTLNLGELEEAYVFEREDIPSELLRIWKDDESGDSDIDIDSIDLYDKAINIHELRESWGLIDEDDLADITDEMVESRPNIKDLLRDGILREVEVGKYLEGRIESEFFTNDPIHDLMETEDMQVETIPDMIVGYLIDEMNAAGDGEYGDLMQMSGPEGEYDINQTLIGIGDNMQSHLIDPAYMRDGLSIRLIAWFTPVVLENMSEHGKMYRTYVEENRDVDAHLGTVDEEDVTRSFAYPELIQDDTILDRLAQIGRQPPNYTAKTKQQNDD